MKRPVALACLLGCLLVTAAAQANGATTKKKRALHGRASQWADGSKEDAVERGRGKDILPGVLDLRETYRRYGCGASILISKPYPCRLPFEE